MVGAVGVAAGEVCWNHLQMLSHGKIKSVSSGDWGFGNMGQVL